MTSELTSTSAQDAVETELRALRRRNEGVTVETIAGATTICELLGAGDPYLAFTRLQHHLLERTHDRAITAAAAALGLSSDEHSVLGRLEDAAGELHIDQRHARRLSDEGFRALAVLITTNWTVEAVPKLDIVFVGDARTFVLMAHASYPSAIQMSEPRLTMYVGEDVKNLDIAWCRTEDNGRTSLDMSQPLPIALECINTSLAVVWRGEMWPKFGCHLHEMPSIASVETLGNKLMIRMRPPTPEQAY